jgi:glycosyltransferase involved in cell wall biosynthesis/Tfp pilus assembly protein PilF
MNSNWKELYENGMQHFKNRDVEKAINDWEKASQIKETEPEIHSVLGNAYKLLNEISKSTDSLKKAVELDPDNFKYHYNYGLLLFEQEQLEESLKYFLEAYRLEPNHASLLNDIGVLYFHLKQYIDAEQFIKKALQLDKNDLHAKINLAYVYIKQNKTTKAYEILEAFNANERNRVEVVELRNHLDEMTKLPLQKSTKNTLHLNFSESDLNILPLEIQENINLSNESLDLDLSIIIPIYNEEENIPILYRQIIETVEEINQTYEIIFVNDGSTDKSFEVLTKLAMDDEKVKVVQFRRNYGQTAALSAGFKYSAGKVIITMDGDLQNDPADIPRLLEKMAEGYDLVNGWRKDRQDKTLSRKIPSQMANKIINKLIEGSKINLNDFGCTLKAYKRGIVKNIHLYGEMHRFIPVFAAWIGVKVTEIPVKHHSRKYGVAKYGLGRVPRVIFDLLVVRFFSDFLVRPIQFFGRIAKNILGWGSLMLAVLTLAKIFIPELFISFNTILILLSVLAIGSFQILIMGLLGEIMMRIYFEGQKKDYYIVEKIIRKRR